MKTEKENDKLTEMYNIVKEMYPNAQTVKIEINPGTIIVGFETIEYTLIEEHGRGDGADKTLWRRSRYDHDTHSR